MNTARDRSMDVDDPGAVAMEMRRQIAKQMERQSLASAPRSSAASAPRSSAERWSSPLQPGEFDWRCRTCGIEGARVSTASAAEAAARRHMTTVHGGGGTVRWVGSPAPKVAVIPSPPIPPVSPVEAKRAAAVEAARQRVARTFKGSN